MNFPEAGDLLFYFPVSGISVIVLPITEHAFDFSLDVIFFEVELFPGQENFRVVILLNLTAALT